LLLGTSDPDGVAPNLDPLEETEVDIAGRRSGTCKSDGSSPVMRSWSCDGADKDALAFDGDAAVGIEIAGVASLVSVRSTSSISKYSALALTGDVGTVSLAPPFSDLKAVPVT
jgi:hypothetical protein